jgi:hypothetical protein
LSWSALAGVDSYQLQQQYNHGDWTNAYQGSGLNKAISGAINGGTYDYRVRGCNVSGCGPWSATAEVLIKIPPPVPTGVYANDRIVNPKLETLTIVWNASPGATAYDVRDGDTGQIVVHTTALSYGAESGATIPHHGYQVRSCNAVACSAWVNASDRMVYAAPRSMGAPVLVAMGTEVHP